jgi:hypothetical protein
MGDDVIVIWEMMSSSPVSPHHSRFRRHTVSAEHCSVLPRMDNSVLTVQTRLHASMQPQSSTTPRLHPPHPALHAAPSTCFEICASMTLSPSHLPLLCRLDSSALRNTRHHRRSQLTYPTRTGHRPRRARRRRRRGAGRRRAASGSRSGRGGCGGTRGARRGRRRRWRSCSAPSPPRAGGCGRAEATRSPSSESACGHACAARRAVV